MFVYSFLEINEFKVWQQSNFNQKIFSGEMALNAIALVLLTTNAEICISSLTLFRTTTMCIVNLNCGDNLDFHQKIFSGKMALNAVAHALALLVHPCVPHLNNHHAIIYEVIILKSTPFMAAKSLLISFSQILASRMLLLFVPTSAKSFSIWVLK